MKNTYEYKTLTKEVITRLHNVNEQRQNHNSFVYDRRVHNKTVIDLINELNENLDE